MWEADMAEGLAPRGSAFAVRFDGIELSPELTDRIAGAVRRAVLSELAELDLTSGVRLQGLRVEDGPTQGIQIVAEREVEGW
jgi:hypothetical protein